MKTYEVEIRRTKVETGFIWVNAPGDKPVWDQLDPDAYTDGLECDSELCEVIAVDERTETLPDDHDEVDAVIPREDDDYEEAKPFLVELISLLLADDDAKAFLAELDALAEKDAFFAELKALAEDAEAE